MNSKVLKEGLPYKIEHSEKSNPFWSGLNEGKLRTTECVKCQSIHFPPSPILCPHCFGTTMKWIELPLEGTVITYTLVTAPPIGFSGNYFLASVQVDKLGKQILGRFDGDKINIGDRVKIDFEQIGEQALLVFKPK